MDEFGKVAVQSVSVWLGRLEREGEKAAFAANLAGGESLIKFFQSK